MLFDWPPTVHRRKPNTTGPSVEGLSRPSDVPIRPPVGTARTAGGSLEQALDCDPIRHGRIVSRLRGRTTPVVGKADVTKPARGANE